MKKTVITNNSLKTQELALELFDSLKKGDKAIVLALQGDLGGGKTVFCKGLAKACGIKEEVLSPTFVIFNRYQIKKKFKNFFHFDCYRLNGAQDAIDLGIKEIINDPDNIVAIEWPEIIKEAVPENAITIKFSFVSQEQRKIEILGI